MRNVARSSQKPVVCGRAQKKRLLKFTNVTSTNGGQTADDRESGANVTLHSRLITTRTENGKVSCTRTRVPERRSRESTVSLSRLTYRTSLIETRTLNFEMAAFISVFLLLLSILLKTTSGASCPEDKNASFCSVSEAIDKQVVTVELKANGPKDIGMAQYRRLQCAILNCLNRRTPRTTEAETTTPGPTTLLLKLTTVQPEPTTTIIALGHAFEHEEEKTTLERTTVSLHRTTTELTTTATTREATTTVPKPTTVTTKLATTTPEPTTTTRKPTTTMREPTTTMREPTTTMREPTTTMREPTTTMREPTTTIREPTTPMREPTTTMREPTTTMREPTTATPEPTTTMREPTTTMREPTTAMPEPTTTTPKPTTTTDEPITTTPEPTTTMEATTTAKPPGPTPALSFRRKRDASMTCGDDIEYTEDDIDLVDLKDSFFKDGILRIPIYLHRNDCIIKDDLLWDAVHYLNETNELQEAVGAEVHNISRGLPKADKISGGLPEVNTISTDRSEADMKPIAVMYFSRYFWIPLALTLLFVLILIIASTVYCIVFRKKNSYAVQKNHYPLKGRVNPVTDVEMLKDEGPVNGHANGHLPRIISDEDGHLVPMSEFNNDPPYEPHAAKDTSTF